MIKYLLFFKSYFSNLEKKATEYNIRKAKKIGVKVGNDCRFYSLNFSTEPYLIEIGDHVTITQNVFFSTHDGSVWVFREKFPEIEFFGKIKIGNNVFIGMNSVILLNTEIGDNCIIAAGSVVKGKFENNSVIAGVPARRIASVEEYYKKNVDNFTFFRSLKNKKISIIEKFRN